MDIRLFKPSVGKEEIDSIKEVFDISWLGLGDKVSDFEKNGLIKLVLIIL